VKITKFEQSGVIIESDKGSRLAIDIGSYTSVGKLEGITADAMIVSHVHQDHFSLEQIKKLSPQKLYIGNEGKESFGEGIFPFEIVVIKNGDQIKVGDIVVDVFYVDHGPNVSAPVRDNFGFLITADNKKIYFAGEMFYESGIDVENLEVDYAFFPVGSFYTFGPQEAFTFAKKFKKIGKAISMHDRGVSEKKVEFVKLAEGNFLAE
jgi:L-ascorbate metabolism protein UlaG (beta-lactamase superfamily)